MFEKTSVTFHSTDIFTFLLLILLFSRPPTLLKELPDKNIQVVSRLKTLKRKEEKSF